MCSPIWCKLILHASTCFMPLCISSHVLFHQAKQQKVERPGASDRGKWRGKGGSPKKMKYYKASMREERQRLLLDPTWLTAAGSSFCRQLHLEECVCDTHAVLCAVGWRLGVPLLASRKAEPPKWGRRQGAVWPGDCHSMDGPVPQLIQESRWWKNALGYCRCNHPTPTPVVGLRTHEQGDAVLLANSLQDSHLNEPNNVYNMLYTLG